MIFLEGRGGRSSVSSPELKQRKRLSSACSPGSEEQLSRNLRAGAATSAEHDWQVETTTAALGSYFKKMVSGNKINTCVFYNERLWGIVWSHKWRQALIRAGAFGWFLIAPSPMERLWRHRESAASFIKTPLIQNHVALSYLNHYLTIIPDLDASVGRGHAQRGTGVAGKPSLRVPGMARGDTESLCWELPCFISAWKGNVLIRDPLMAPEQQRPGEEVRVSQALGYARCTQQQGFPACYHAWEKDHVDVLAGM